MATDLPLSRLEDSFEEEFGKLVPNQEEATPEEILNAAHYAARKLSIKGKITLSCKRPPGGRLKCELLIDFEASGSVDFQR